MIKVNLLVGKKPLDITNVGGFDLSKLNVKYLIIAIVLSYVPDIFVYDFFKNKEADLQKLVFFHNKNFKAVNTKVRSLKNIERQIKALENLERKLKDKLNIVKEIIKKRVNPMNVLLYVSKNIPEDVWLTDISLEEKQFTLKGKSKTVKSVGVFHDNLKNSIFFRKDIKLSNLNPVNNVTDFQIDAYVISYE